MFKVQQGTGSSNATRKKVLVRCSFLRQQQVCGTSDPTATASGAHGCLRTAGHCLCWMCSRSSAWDLQRGADCSFLPLGLLQVPQPQLCCTRLDDQDYLLTQKSGAGELKSHTKTRICGVINVDTRKKYPMRHSYQKCKQ